MKATQRLPAICALLLVALTLAKVDVPPFRAYNLYPPGKRVADLDLRYPALVAPDGRPRAIGDEWVSVEKLLKLQLVENQPELAEQYARTSLAGYRLQGDEKIWMMRRRARTNADGGVEFLDERLYEITPRP